MSSRSISQHRYKFQVIYFFVTKHICDTFSSLVCFAILFHRLLCAEIWWLSSPQWSTIHFHSHQTIRWPIVPYGPGHCHSGRLHSQQDANVLDQRNSVLICSDPSLEEHKWDQSGPEKPPTTQPICCSRMKMNGERRGAGPKRNTEAGSCRASGR